MQENLRSFKAGNLPGATAHPTRIAIVRSCCGMTEKSQLPLFTSDWSWNRPMFHSILPCCVRNRLCSPEEKEIRSFIR